MASEDPLERLPLLTTRQREVLGLVCSGMDYKSIAGELYIAESTVKAHMGNIYQKLGLDSMPGAQRTKTIFEVCCPALDQVTQVLVDESEEPEPVAEIVEKMVDEDERALVIWQSKPLTRIEPIRLEPIPYQPRRFRWTVFGMIVGVILIGGIFFTLRGALETDTPPEEQTEATPVVQMVEVPVELTVLVTTTPEPAMPSTTPVVQEVVVVVTATSPPTPIPSPTPSEPANTSPDTILEVGEWWKTESIWLRVSEVEFIESGSVFFEIDFWNRTEDQLFFEWSGLKSFSLVDNTGHFYTFRSTASASWNEIVEADELITLHNGYGTTVSFNDPFYFDPAMTDLWFTVIELSRVTFAKWHITVPK